MLKKIVKLSALVAATVATPIVVSAATFSEDLHFLGQHTDVVLLSDPSSRSQVAVAPRWQGRVMTSSANGEKGFSFGWVNRELIASRKLQPHINVFGGEDRFWLGPEGGQFSVFFAPSSPFNMEHWVTPAAVDTEPFEVLSKSLESVQCRSRFQLTNYSGTRFDLEVNREVHLVNAFDMLAKFGVKLPSEVMSVSFESVNRVKNMGEHSWTKDTGLLSVWILGMLNASAETVVVIPFESGAESILGPKVNDNYFGKVPRERLRVKDKILYFRGDANYRS